MPVIGSASRGSVCCHPLWQVSKGSVTMWTRHGTYVYRSVRRGWQVRSEYMGAGLLGAEQLALNAIERENAKQERDRLRAVVAADRKLDGQLDEALRQVSQVTRAALVLSGHYSARRVWRLRRDNDD